MIISDDGGGKRFPYLENNFYIFKACCNLVTFASISRHPVWAHRGGLVTVSVSLCCEKSRLLLSTKYNTSATWSKDFFTKCGQALPSHCSERVNYQDGIFKTKAKDELFSLNIFH